MAIIGKGQLSLLDLNDAIISGTAPANPSVGTLWIDSSGEKQILKKWTGSAWDAQPLDLEQLDPDFTEHVSTGLSTALTNLGNLSSDDKVTASERQVIADKLAEILGTVPGGTTALPAVATVNTYTTGDYYQARKSATDAGLSTGDANYTALETAYTTLSTYLNGIVESGSYLWDVSEAAKDKVHTVVGTTFRSNWQAFYNALGNLQTRTAKRVADAKSEAQTYAESYAKSYRSQLVANGFGDMASNKNFSAFTYNATEKVSGPGSFLRTATGEVVSDEFIKVEADRTYRIAMSVKTSTTSNTHNLGVECYNAAGASLGKRHIVRNSGGTTVIPSVTSWQHYEGVIGGLNAGAGTVSDKNFPAGTTQVKIWFNLNNGGAANSVYIADVSFALEQIEANKDYNGISMSADKGLVVESTRNTTTMSATKGIEIKRKSDNANVFSVDANTGNLNITGNITMTGGVISWDVLNKPTAEQVGAATPEQVSSAVQAISVGGTNLLLQSETILCGDNDPGSNATTKTLMEENGLNFYRYAPTAGSVGKAISIFEGIYPKDVLDKAWKGKDVTFSLRVRCSKVGAKVMFRPFTYNPGWGALVFAPTKIEVIADGRWQTMSYVFKNFPQDMHNDPTTGIVSFDPEVEGSMAGHTLDVRGYKIEFGNMFTDWAPAPNDITAPLKETKALTDAWKAPNTTEISGTAIKTGTLDAGKITTGTLNASLVSVTNLNAANIQTGTLDASKVTISSTTAGVTINSSGVVANNATTGVQVVMNSSTGFEIKKSGNTVFTVNSDGSLVAKNITLQGGSITWGTGTGKITPPTATDVGAAVIGDITSAVSAVQIGGRNLIRYKRSDGSTYFGSSQSTITIDEANGVIRGVSNGTANPSWPRIVNHSISVVSFELGVDYTVSFWARGSVNAGRTFTISQGDGLNSILTSSAAIETGWKKFQTTFKPSIQPSASTGFYIYTGGTTGDTTSWVEIKELKLEKGNKATDWTPAPEDVDTKIENIEVGGKNYAERLGGSEYEKTKLYSTDGNFTTTQTDANGKLWMKFTGAATLRINTIKLSPSTTYTWSFYVYTTGTDTQIVTNQWSTGGYNHTTHNIGTSPRRIIVTFTTPSSTSLVDEILHISSLASADSYFFADFQLERGNKATDWKEAESYTLSKLATALSDASSAKSSVQDMTSDLKVTPLEKNELKRLWDAIKLEYTRINDLGVSLTVSSTTRTNFTNAYNALNSTAPRIETDVLANMNTTYDFVSTTNRDTFRTQINTYFTRREEMEKAIAEQQKSNTTTVTNKVNGWDHSSDSTKIDGNKIYTGSIYTDQLAANAVNAEKLAANAVTASKIKVGAVNLVNDPFIEDPALGAAGASAAIAASLWDSGNGSTEVVAETPYAKVLRFRSRGNQTITTNKFAVDPNKAYRVTMTFKHLKADKTNTTGSFYFGLNMFAANGTTVQASTGTYNPWTKTFGGGSSNQYFYNTGKGNAAHNTWKMIDTYIMPSGFHGDITKVKNPTHPLNSGQIVYMGADTRQISIRALNYNGATDYGDATDNDLYIASLQVTEVDAGTIVADNIVTGTLNAGLITVTNLNAGSITTGTLDASKITVTKLNAGSLTTGTLDANLVTVTNLSASNIKSGTLDAARINAGSLKAEKLSFSNNVNLMVDGYDSFENCIMPGAGARSSGLTVSFDTTYSLDGLKSLKMQGTLTDNYIYLVNANNSTTYNMQVVAGRTYMASFYAYATEAVQIQAYLRRNNDAGHSEFRGAINTVANQWTRFFGKVTIPAGCTRVSMRVDINAANKPVWFDCFKLEECLTTDSEPGPWATASTTVIDGSNIKTGTLDANLVNVTNLSADNIKSGTLSAISIDGATITGGTFFTEEEEIGWGGSTDTVLVSQFLTGSMARYKSQTKTGSGIIDDLWETKITDAGFELYGGGSYLTTASLGQFGLKLGESFAVDLRPDGNGTFTGKMKSGSVETGSIIIPTTYLNVSGTSAEMIRLTANSGTYGYMSIYDGATRVGYIGSVSNASRSLRVSSDAGWLDLTSMSGLNMYVNGSSRFTVTGSKTTSNNDLLVNGSIEGALKHSSGYMEIGSFSSGYGSGQAEVWYRADSRTLNVVSRNSGDTSSNNAKLYSDRMIAVAYEAPAGDPGYLQCESNQEYRVTQYKSSVTYRPIRASSFPTGSSINYKTNLEKIESSMDALALIKGTQVFKYHLKSNVDALIFDKPKIGVIAEMVDPIIRDEDGVDPYSMVSISWAAIQQQQKMIESQSSQMEALEEIVETQDKEIEDLREMVKLLMTRVETLEGGK